MAISRKHFVAATALGAAGSTLGQSAPAAAQGASIHFRVLKPTEYDRAAMLRIIQVDKPNKQAFQSVAAITFAGVASLYVHMQNSINAFEFSYAMGPGSLATLAVLTGSSVVYALSDAIWRKYGIGAALKLAPTNVYYRAKSLKANGNPDDFGAIYQDWSAEAVLHRGGAFMVCHNALTGLAVRLGPNAGVAPDDALADFMANLLSGFLPVPAGVAATQLALEHGWQPYPIL